MPNMKELMPTLARGGGRWSGTYTHTDPDGHVLDHHDVHTFSSFPTDGSSDYRLETHNVWPGGKESRATHVADYKNGQLEWRDTLVGWIRQVDDAIYLKFSFPGDASIVVHEMIQVAKDGQSRARTWHWFKDDRLFKITLTKEKRAA